MKLDDLKPKKRNPVAKNMGFNKAQTHKDKKKALRDPRKNIKHKSKLIEKFTSLLEDGRVWTKEEIRKKIETDDRWLLRGLHRIYQLQTEEEKSSRITNQYNNVGFSGFDADFLSRAAEKYAQGGGFSPRYIAAIRKAMLKYSGQLTKIANGEIR